MASTPSSTRRVDSAAATRQRLLDAAAKAFAEAGYGGASVRDIARRAECTTGALYAHFDGKEDLFLALLDQRYANKARELSALVEEAAGQSDAVQRLTARFAALGRADGDWDLLATEFWLFAARRPDVRRKLAAAHHRLRSEVARIIEAQRGAEGSNRAMDPLALATMAIAIGDGLGIQSRIDPDAVPAELFGESLVRLFVEGVR